MPENDPSSPQKNRLTALDALRGADMLWIIGAQGIFAALYTLTNWQGWKTADAYTAHHTPWHGFTLYDLVFPLFIFLSGVTLGLSNTTLKNKPLTERKPYYLKALKRLTLLIILGIIYNHAWGTGIPLEIENIRFTSVLARIGIAWFVAALLVWHTTPRTQLITTATILIVYWILLTFIPVPGGQAGLLTPEGTWNAWIDQNFLPGTTYQNRPYDPEGLLSHMPAIANALLGVAAGRLIKKADQFGQWKTAGLLTLTGITLYLTGWLWNLHFPANKELWTSSFVLVTAGWSFALLALFYAVIDILNLQKWAYPLVTIGTNSILIYLASAIINWGYIAASLFGGIIKKVPENWTPLITLTALLLPQLLILHFLHKRKIHLKI